MQRQIYKFIALQAFVTMTFVACGQKSQSPEMKKGGLDATAGDTLKCKSASECKAETIVINAAGANGGMLTGYVNRNVGWTFTGNFESGLLRKVLVFVSGEPAGSKILSSGTSQAQIDWQPTSIAQSTSTIKVVVRDLTRCEMMLKDKKKTCSDANVTNLNGYETRQEYQWQIQEEPQVNAQCSQPAATSSSASGMSGCLQGALPNIASLFSGGVQGFMQVGMGCMTGVMQQKQVAAAQDLQTAQKQAMYNQQYCSGASATTTTTY